MKKLFMLLVLGAVGIAPVLAQTTDKTPVKDKPAVVEPPKNASLELAKKAVEFHGGDKFLNYKTLIARGTTDVSVNFGGQTQNFPGTYVLTLSGDRYRFELNTPIRSFKQTHDGQQTVSSEPSITLPPVNRLGLPLLQKYNAQGFTVGELPEPTRKKKSGFRITAPDGYYTDFFVDDKTGEVKGYESTYDFGGRTVSTAVEIDKLRDVDGVKLEEKYSQRFELGITFYSVFKAKDLILNAAIADDVFAVEKAQ